MCRRKGGLTLSALDYESRGLGSRPGACFSRVLLTKRARKAVLFSAKMGL